MTIIETQSRFNGQWQKRVTLNKGTGITLFNINKDGKKIFKYIYISDSDSLKIIYSGRESVTIDEYWASQINDQDLAHEELRRQPSDNFRWQNHIVNALINFFGVTTQISWKPDPGFNNESVYPDEPLHYVARKFEE